MRRCTDGSAETGRATVLRFRAGRGGGGAGTTLVAVGARSTIQAGSLGVAELIVTSMGDPFSPVVSVQSSIAAAYAKGEVAGYGGAATHGTHAGLLQSAKKIPNVEGMRGLIVDYFGVLDGTEEDRQNWREILEKIRTNDVRFAILSNEPLGPGADRVKEDARTFGIDTVVLSGEIGVEKPEYAAYARAAETLGLKLKDCVMVDDSIENVHGAVNAGMIGVFYQVFERQAVELRGLFDLD